MYEVLASIWDILGELAIWLFIGAAIAGILHVGLPADFIKRHLGKPGLGSVIKAALIGVPMPLCSCSVIPTGLALKKDGAGNGAALSFIISTPQTGVDSIAVTAAFLGWPFAIFKVIAAFMTGIIGGILADEKSEASETESGVDSEHKNESEVAASCCASTAGHSSIREKIKAAVHFAVWDLLQAIWRWLLIGVIISAVIGVYLPDIMPAIAGNGILTMFIVLLMSVPMYVCATASVPIAASLVIAGFPMGAALVFLMAGPATNIATIGAVASVLGKRALIVYLSVVIIASMGLGIVYDMFISGSFAAPEMMHHHHGDGAVFSQIMAVLLLLLCVMFAFKELKTYVDKQETKSCCDSGDVSGETAMTSCCRPQEKTVKSCCGPQTAEVTDSVTESIEEKRGCH
ncbi:MAG: SO_0444 family Cu/Zn efflux transporter [Planctomycetes bacterium]|nr:SO_0444 family Cu/Zn efflux transporter [Planctomycetota bacterium]